MSEDSGLIRSSSLMGLGTILSRATGFIRNLLLVAVLGTGILADTYNVANTTPNILYNLLIGGALSAVFVPQIVKSFRDADGGSAYVSRLVSLLTSALILITTIAMIIAPLFISLYAPSFSGRPRDITIAFALYCLPQILFYGLFGILGQVANAKEKFGPMMWAPIANNVVVIVLFSYFLSVTDEISLQTITDSQIRLLGIGTTLGIVLQALILIPTIASSGLKLRFRTDWRGVGLDKAIRLASWMFLFVLISQLGFLVTVNLATRAGVAAEAAGIAYGVGYTPYANAYLILLLPHSIVTISIVTALLPKLSNFAIDKKLDEVKNLLNLAMRYVGIVTVPASFFFLLFGERVEKRGKNFSQSPVSTKVVIPARGSLDITVLMNSSLIRSAEIIESRSAIDFIATRTASSMVNPSCAAKRAARNIRSGSSEKESSGELGVRNTRFKRSVTPL